MSLHKVSEGRVEKPHNRKTKRALQKNMRENRADMERISEAACRIFEGDSEKAKKWLYAPKAYLDDKSPIEMVMLGEADEVLKRVIAKLADEGDLRVEELSQEEQGG